MSVDKEYIEEVKEVDFESVLEDFGIEASYEQSGNGLDLQEYTTTSLSEMYDGDDFIGRPILSDVYTVEFKDKNTGDVTVRHKIDLVLLDDTYEDEKDAYIFPINLNSDNIDFEHHCVKDVNSASGLYALAMGLLELKAKGISNRYNYMDKVSIKSLQKQVKSYEELTVIVKEKKFTDRKTKEETYYNSFRITNGE